MCWRRHYSLWQWVSIAILSPTPAFAHDDREFCLAAQQLAIATEKDVGLWIDRATRNAGVAVSCERKLVEFKRFTYTSSASMDEAWRARNAASWNANHCKSSIWGEAIRNDWKIVLVVASADGRQVALTARCE